MAITNKYVWDKNNQYYDFSTVYEMLKKDMPVITVCKEIERILGDECSPQEAFKIEKNIAWLFRPSSSKLQQPSKPPVPTCPRCGSTAITTGARGVNGFLGFIGASKTVNRCANCGNTWTPRMK